MQDEGLPALTEEQYGYALQVLGAALDGSRAQEFVLKGPAGTGKTTVLTWIILALAYVGEPARVCASTNKACSVLREKLRRWGNRFPLTDPVTIHSLLKLRASEGTSGDTEFHQSQPCQLGGSPLVIVDECSMVGAVLYGQIKDSCSGNGASVLYAGDPLQLPPVKETAKSQTFGVANQLILTKVLRHDGAILDLATKVRVNNFLPVVRAAKGDGSQIFTHDGQDAFQEAWISSLQDALTEKGSTDEVVMLTFKNENRRRFNDIARKALMGEGVGRFEPGDVLIAIDPWMRGDRVIFSNNQNIGVQSVSFLEAFEPVPGLGVTFKTWLLASEGSQTFYVLDDSELKRFDRIKKAVKSQIAEEVAQAKSALAMAFKKGATPDRVRELQDQLSEANAASVKYHKPLKEFYANVDFKYSMTTHKAQGSEFKTVFLNDDYTESKNEDVSLFYVGVTRASENLHHVDNSPRARVRK